MIYVRYMIPASVDSASNILQVIRAFRFYGGGSYYDVTSCGAAHGNRNIVAGYMMRPSNGFDSNDGMTWFLDIVDFPGTTSALQYGFETRPEGGNTTGFGYSIGDNSIWGFDSDILIVAQEIKQ
jgi:hypothetical protein